MTIRVLYSCEGCGLKEVGVDVPARLGDEDVVAWMERTIRLAGNDHRRRSLGCHPKSLQDLKIPITGADRVGGPAIQ